MCGIAAAFDRTGRGIDPEALVCTRDRMAVRGPDGTGLWMAPDRHVGLAHRRLAIIDTSDAGIQPIVSADGRFHITFNGEIYNYAALKDALIRDGHTFRTGTDTEVILTLYAREGAGMLERLRGMYALAIHDAEARTLFLARDPYGIKPLYLADDGRRFAAASQVQALLAGGGIDTTPEPAGHAGFFLWGHVPDPFTLYRGIRALPAGHHLLVEEGRVNTPVAFASIPDRLAEAEREAGEVRDVAESLREAMRDTIRHHLVADVPVGVFLSAGLDSTTLAALTAETPTPLQTVTLGFEEFRGTPRDEVPLAEAVARHLGAKHDTVWTTKSDFTGALDGLMEAMDQPTIDGVNTYFVSRAAAQAGLKVVLSGLGGDELFGGYPTFRDVPRLVGTVGRVPAARVLGRGVRALTAPVVRRVTSPKYAGLLEYGSGYGGAYLLRRALYMPWELGRVLDPDVAREGLATLQTVARLDATARPPRAPGLKVTALESCWYMRHQLLRDADWAGMAHSLELRTPLVDWTLLDRVARLRAAHPALGKRDMARTPATSLPADVLNRPKTGFSIPVGEWVRAEATGPEERGLRGWARFVHGRFAAGL